MKELDLHRFLDIGVALTQEKDHRVILELILNYAMEITNCDGGTIYLLSNDALEFKIMRTISKNYYRGAGGENINLPPVPLLKSNVCACSAIEHKIISVADVYQNEKYDFSGPRNYDKITGYRTMSMLVVPLDNHFGEIVGVLQLINAQDEKNNIIAFDQECQSVIKALASQGAITLTNMRYLTEIKELLNSFVKVLSNAIDRRTPYNANHTRNMVKYGEGWIDYINSLNEQNIHHFSQPQKEEVLMSVWLHDIGKLVIPLSVMNKESRLGKKITDVCHRFEVMRLLVKIKKAGGADALTSDREIDEIARAEKFICELNNSGFLSDEKALYLNELAQKTYVAEDGTEKPWITSEEFSLLSIKRGTLSAEERSVMESHVSVTESLLSEISFSREYKNVPCWASMHHETLDGKGYPHKTSGSDIPAEVRMITILDVYDALTANDRPYKPPMPPEKAFAILNSMADEGKLDKALLDSFFSSNAWKKSV